MKVVRLRSWSERVSLSRPYTIAFATTDAADLSFVELVDETGAYGLGAASPVAEITGESAAACAEALSAERLDWLVGRDVRDFRDHAAGLSARFAGTPAAQAAVDVALYDLAARRKGVPLVELLGRVHDSLPTSVTIGITSETETLAEAREHVGRGFRILKLKIGVDLDAGIALIERLRDALPSHVRLRVDANEALTLDHTLRLCGLAGRLGIELIEQPLDAALDRDLLEIPASMRRIIALDESIMNEADAESLAGSAGIFNVKLMKCGGITPARAIAALADRAGVEIMWGCMDESVIGIAAALHLAYACSATRYLDLDGSFDLARDPAAGGFALVDGCLVTTSEPGLGCRLTA